MNTRRVMVKRLSDAERRLLLLAEEWLKELGEDDGEAVQLLATVKAEAADREAMRLARCLYIRSRRIGGLVSQHLEAAAVDFRREIRQRREKRGGERK